MKHNTNLQIAQTMIYLSNIPSRKYKLPRKKKKLFIKQYGVKSYNYQRVIFYLKNNGLSKTIDLLKQLIINVKNAATFLKRTLESIAIKIEKLVREIIILKIEHNLPNFSITEMPFRDGVVYQLNQTL